jgi:hypothetical protein
VVGGRGKIGHCIVDVVFSRKTRTLTRFCTTSFPAVQLEGERGATITYPHSQLQSIPYMNLDPAIQSELLSYIGQLPGDDQARVVEYARTLADKKKPLLRGTPGKDLLHLAGTIPHDDLELMKRAIEEDCERIDWSEW